VPIAAIETQPSGFALLVREVSDAGLLERRPGYYFARIGATVVAYVVGWWTLLVLARSWAVLGVAVLMGVVYTQIGFLSHEAGHQQIFRARRANRLLGLAMGNGLIGLSFGWWVPKHNAHHARPNEIGRDPDVGNGIRDQDSFGLLAENHPRLVNWWLRRRVCFFFPLMLLRSTGLHISGAESLWRRRDRAAALETVLIVLHVILYAGAVFWILSPTRAVAFIAVQQATFSLYLGCSFAPNHKGMPMVDDGCDWGFARRQVLTARNVKGGRFLTFALGGLNYQVEHHLFPTMPRPNLARAQVLVRSFCVQSELGYSEDSVIGCYREAVRPLRLTAPLG
jgi:fatty acid desaturase